MKKLFLLSFAFIGLFTTANAQSSEKEKETQEVKNENGAKIEFESETIDYGTIENKSDGNREFKFTNTGNEPLLITNAKGSCGCTVPTWPRTPIAPGESSVIKVKYATNRTGAFSKSITLTTNAVDTNRKTLRIKGVVKPPIPEKPAENTEEKITNK